VIRDVAVLLDRIAELERRPRGPRVRLALAEAEFRVAIAPGTPPSEAVERLNRARGYDPYQPKLHLHLGRVLHRSGQRRAAIAAYRRALRLAPSSRRVHLLLASVLLDLGRAERELGQQIVDALAGGAPEELAALGTAIDGLFAEPASDPQSGADPGRPRRPRSRRPIAADVWRPALVAQLCRPKPVRAQVQAALDAGRPDGETGRGLPEYTLACLLLLVSGEPVGDVRRLLDHSHLSAATHPAVTLVRTALDLAETDDPARFVESAALALEMRLVPGELVAWLHFRAFGPDRLPMPAGVEMLDSYPERVRSTAALRELRIAILDAYARRAWSDERLDEAKLLWQETVGLDPCRIPVAVNLALVAAATKAAEEYRPAWDRLAELLYLQSAAIGDVHVHIEDRITLHLTMARQSRARYCSGPEHQLASQQELTNWIAAPDVLLTWLREWDLYYLNARLRFRSPAHLLGASPDATAPAVAEAHDALRAHLDRVAAEHDWAGLPLFAALARDLLATAADRLAQRRDGDRDAADEREQADADALLDDALRRATTLHSLAVLVARQPGSQPSPLGPAIARCQSTLPLPLLQPRCVERGVLGPGERLADVFERDLVVLAGAAAGELGADASDADLAARLARVEEYASLSPRVLRVQLQRCVLLDRLGRHDDAYHQAVAALRGRPPDAEEAATDEAAAEEIVGLIERIAARAMPGEFSGRVMPVDRLVPTVRAAMTTYAHAFLPRARLAVLLVHLGGTARLREAESLLKEGIRMALTPRVRDRFAKQLARIPGALADGDTVRG
jgi:tetratricopeptide (TPR) repeat protein